MIGAKSRIFCLSIDETADEVKDNVKKINGLK